MRNHSITAGLVSLSLLLGGCSATLSKQEAGAATGALLGAALGYGLG